MSDNGYVPITEDVRAVYMARGEAVTSRTAAQHDRRAESFDAWLAAHDAQVREEGAKAMRDAAAFLVEEEVSGLTLHSPEWYSRADLAAAIRALPIPSTGAESEGQS